LIYPAVSSRVLSTFVCRHVNDSYYLVADFTRLCYDDTWYAYLPYTICMVFVYPIGIPLLFYLLIRFLRQGESMSSIGFLYEAYEKDTWYFELVDMFVKLILTSLLAFFPTGAQLQMGMAVIGCYINIILVFRPYIRTLDDQLHLVALNEIMLLLLCGIILQFVGGFEQNTGVDAVLSVLLITIILGTMLIFVYNALRFAVKLIRVYQNKKARRKAGDLVEKEEDSCCIKLLSFILNRATRSSRVKSTFAAVRSEEQTTDILLMQRNPLALDELPPLTSNPLVLEGEARSMKPNVPRIITPRQPSQTGLVPTTTGMIPPPYHASRPSSESIASEDLVSNS